jgi:hypothetical protein
MDRVDGHKIVLPLEIKKKKRETRKEAGLEERTNRGPAIKRLMHPSPARVLAD